MTAIESTFYLTCLLNIILQHFNRITVRQKHLFCRTSKCSIYFARISLIDLLNCEWNTRKPDYIGIRVNISY